MQRQISAQKVVTVSFLVDILDFVLNALVAFASGSVIMLTASLQGLSDLVSATFLYLGIKEAQKPADKQHPFGYGREAYFWTLMSALIMFSITSTLSIYFGVQRISNPEPIDNELLAFGLLIFNTCTNAYAFSLSYQRLKGRSLKNIWRLFAQSYYIETKTAFVIDLIGTSAAALGLVNLGLYIITGNQTLDGIGAVMIGVVQAILSLILLMAVKDLLVGKVAPSHIESKIKETALKNQFVEEVLDLKTLIIGPDNVLVNLELHLKKDLTTNQIEALIDEIKADIKQEIPSVEHIQIEVETPDREIVEGEIMIK